MSDSNLGESRIIYFEELGTYQFESKKS
jgi:hypothetical protein